MATLAPGLDTRTALMLMSLLELPARDALVNRDCQQRAAAVLADLLTNDLPLVSWSIRNGIHPHVKLERPKEWPSLVGQACSHQTVRDYAYFFGTDVVLEYGDTPKTTTVVDGIGVQVWCAPEYRDRIDAAAGEVA
ncbi:hypothetical protein [Nocardiopsis suaedae]|uniref:Uncharacterized protein n=1 Tax=Nocardiopsis suaedae TaxID=3018444 RepID=A0ABT4TJ69_9ACTN|nr:hypothetical protein [Nocardiopsis suaedae]MDA2804455.1 hypothetical protein [Nocardiopsis suaedae]